MGKWFLSHDSEVSACVGFPQRSIDSYWSLKIRCVHQQPHNERFTLKCLGDYKRFEQDVQRSFQPQNLFTPNEFYQVPLSHLNYCPALFILICLLNRVWSSQLLMWFIKFILISLRWTVGWCCEYFSELFRNRYFDCVWIILHMKTVSRNSLRVDCAMCESMVFNCADEIIWVSSP